MPSINVQEDLTQSWWTALHAFQTQSQRMTTSYFEGMQKQLPFSPPLMGDIFIKAGQALFENPSHLLEAQADLLRETTDLWQKIVSPEKEDLPPSCPDKRFQHEAWETVPYFLFIKEYYLMSSRWLQNLVTQVEGLDDATLQKLQFYTNQLVEAVSPSNFPLSNPEVLEELIKTQGGSLQKGFETLLEDMSAGRGMIMTDPAAFTLGETLATTQGDVIFRNDLFELIHYFPLTKKQYATPLLIIPPWINKYYIFDLSPSNSFVKWMLEQGHNVFIMSWVNPGAELGLKTFEDYLLEGAYRACEIVTSRTQSPSLHAMGYCVGGDLLTALSAYLAKTPAPFSLQTMTLLATIIDFSKAGDLKIFMDDEHLQHIEEVMIQKGFVDVEIMKSIFSLLRPKEMVWSFFIKNYLLGQVPPAFDFLYWNSDSTRIPAALHRFVLRKWFQQNLLMAPGGIDINDVSLDLKDITTPTLFLSTLEDHISPWKSSYPAVHLFKGPLKFILAGSGHVAGVMNPPARHKYGFFTHSEFPENAEDWLTAATKFEGSWWTEWHDWVVSFGKKKGVPMASYPILESAPGTYVREK